MFKELKGPHKKPHIHAVFAGEKLTIAFDGEISCCLDNYGWG